MFNAPRYTLRHRLLLLLLPALSFCARDRSVDDYRRDQVIQELSRLQAIEGVYNGKVAQSGSGAALGALSLQLKADARSQTTPDGTRGEDRALLKMTLTVYTTKSLTLVFDDANFDSDVRSLKGTASVKRSDGSTSQLHLAANFTGPAGAETLAGSLEVFGFDGQGVRFEIKHGGVLPWSADGSPQEAARAQLGLDPYYTGSVDYPLLGARDFGLELESVPQTREEELLDLISPVKALRASLSFSADLRGQLSGSFDKITGNLRLSGSVAAAAPASTPGSSSMGSTSSSGGASTQLSLECKQTPSGWACALSNNWRSEVLRVPFEKTDKPFMPVTPELTGSSFEGLSQLKYAGAITTRLMIEPRQRTPEDAYNEFFRGMRTYRGTLAFSRRAQIVIDKMSYYLETKSWIGETNLVVNGQATTLRLECQDAAPNLNCTFRSGLRDEVTRLSMKSLPAGAAPMKDPPFGYAESYRGHCREDGSTQPIRFESRPPSKDDEILEILGYIKPLRVVVDFGSTIVETFETALWQKEVGTLNARKTHVYGGSNFDVTLDCNEKREGESLVGWSCIYMSGLTGELKHYELDRN